MKRAFAILVGSALLAMLGPAAPARALSITFSQTQLLEVLDATTDFGGNGGIVSRTVDGDGVLFELQGSTIDFGKVAARIFLSLADLNAYDAFGFHFDIVLAENPIVTTAYIQRQGKSFQEAVSADHAQGDAYDVVLPMTLDYSNVLYLGYQVFAAGGIEEPPAQTLLLRVSPLAGAVAVPTGDVPEPGPAVLLALGAGSLLLGDRLRRPA
ncbi:MAG TPA: hypothetical protein VKB65_04110 [Myxococcota bacterium]|nr:hypothetical protein [Myxococcota bacterium]